MQVDSTGESSFLSPSQCLSVCLWETFLRKLEKKTKRLECYNWQIKLHFHFFLPISNTNNLICFSLNQTLVKEGHDANGGN